MSAPLQRAYVEILPEMRNFGNNLRTQVRESVSTSTRELDRLNHGVSNSVRSVEREHEGLFKNMRSQIKELASFALPTLGAIEGFKFIKESIAASREEGKQLRQTEAVIKSTGGAAHVTAKGVEELAKQQSIHTGITATQIRSNENLLLTFTAVRNEVGKGNDIFDQATKTVLDMSVALKEDGKSAAIQLGKALNDPVKGYTALKRVGVTFTDQQKEQIKTMVASGNMLGAQKVILAELSKEFGGSAAAQADASDKMKAGFEAFRVELGNRIVPLIDKFETFITNHVLPAVTSLFEEFGKSEGTFAQVRSAIAAVIGIGLHLAHQVIDVLVIAFHALSPLLREAAHFVRDELLPAFKAVADILVGALGSSLKAVGGFIQRHTTLVRTLAVMLGTVLLVWKAWTTAIKIWTFVTKVATAVQLAFNVVMDANPVLLVIAAIAALAAGMIYAYKHSKTFRDIVADIGSVFLWVWRHVLAPVVDFFANNWRAALNIAMAVLTPFLIVPTEIVKHWGAITSWFGGLFHAVTGALRSTGSWLVGAGRGILNGLWTGIKFVWDHLIWPMFVSIPVRVIRTFGNALSWLVSAGRAVLRGLWIGLRFIWDNLIYPLFIGIPRRVIGFFGNAIGWLVNAGQRVFRGLWSGIKAGWNTITDWLGGIGGRILRFFGDAVSWLWHAGVRIFTGLLHGIKDGFNAIVNWFKDLPQHILHALGIASPPPWAIRAGHWIIKGLHKGLTASAGVIKHFFGHLANDFIGGMIERANPWLVNAAKGLGISVGAIGKAGMSGIEDLIGVKVGGTLDLGNGGQFGGPGSPRDLLGWVAKAVGLAHAPASWIAPIIRRAMYESGGNPFAVNNWDQNAKAGHPSKGLMQTIDSTFSAYHLPGYSNIWDPVANVIAAIRYIRANYGTIFAIDPPIGGYAKGSWKIDTDQIARLHKNEMVLPARIANAVRSALSPGAAATVSSSAGGVAIAQLDELALARAIVAALAGARLQFDEHGIAQIVTRHQTINAIRGAHR